MHAIHHLGSGVDVKRIVQSEGLVRFNELLAGN
jgi:hypothetical protein